MITYKDVDYETSESLREALNAEFAALAYPYEVKHKTYGEGQLTFIKAPLMGGSLYATVEFVAGIKTLAMDVVLANQLLEMPEILIDTILEAQTVFKEDFMIREQAQREAAIAAAERALAAKKKAAKEAKEKEDKKERNKKESDEQPDEEI